MTTGLFVLGMHRSGTSALTASLGMMGANLGNHLLPGREDNKKGFFEDVRCVTLNIQILRAFGTTGYGGVALPADWHTAPAVAKGMQRARNILADLGREPVYALKDPRLSLLGDMWFAAASELGHEIKCIVAVRHPLQVARSLEKRQRVLRYAGYLMWILYNVEIMAQSARYPRCFVSFEDLQNGTEQTLSRVAKFVGDKEHFWLDEQRLRQVGEFLDPSMVSSREDFDQQYKQIGAEVTELYQALRTGQPKKFAQLMNKGMLRMFSEMTKSYRQHIVRLHRPAGEAGGQAEGVGRASGSAIAENIISSEREALDVFEPSLSPAVPDTDEHSTPAKSERAGRHGSKYEPLIEVWRRAGENGMTFDDLAAAAESIGIAASRNSLRSMVGNMKRAGSAIPVGDRYVWREAEASST